jgi:hypothetical protein
LGGVGHFADPHTVENNPDYALKHKFDCNIWTGVIGATPLADAIAPLTDVRGSEDSASYRAATMTRAAP